MFSEAENLVRISLRKKNREENAERIPVIRMREIVQTVDRRSLLIRIYCPFG